MSRKLHDVRSVVGLVRKIHRGLIVVRGADKPHIRRNGERATVAEQRRGGIDRAVSRSSFCRWTSAPGGKEVSEVLLGMGEIHLVEHDDVGTIGVVRTLRAVRVPAETPLVEPPLEGVEMTDEILAIAPPSLDFNQRAPAPTARANARGRLVLPVPLMPCSR